MADSPGILSFRFDHEDRVQRARRFDTDKNGVQESELGNPSNLSEARSAVTGYKLPGATEINISDAFNSQRLCAASFAGWSEATEAQKTKLEAADAPAAEKAYTEAQKAVAEAQKAVAEAQKAVAEAQKAHTEAQKLLEEQRQRLFQILYNSSIPTNPNESITQAQMLNSLDWSQENFNQWQSSSPRDMQYIARDNRQDIISTTPSNTKSNEVLISGGFTYNVITSHGRRKIVPLTPEKYFLYDRKSQTARSLTPVTGSQDAFYDVSEPSTLLLRSDSHFTTEKPSIDLSDPSPHPTKTLSDNKTYIFLEGKWQLISQ